MSDTQTETDYRDYFLRFKPKHILWALVYSSLIVTSLGALIFCCYIILCFMDRQTPIEDMHYKATDAKIGETTTVTMNFYRTRICAYSFVRMITDSKGKIVFLEQGGRKVNGPIRHVELTDHYPIARNAAPGKAIMHLYASWECPANIIHKINPIEREYTDTLELSLKEGDKDISSLETSEAEEYIDKENKDKLAREMLIEQQKREQASTPQLRRKE